jgi:hypothetical protein
MRTASQHRIDRAVAHALYNCGDYLLPHAALIRQIGLIVVTPRATLAEIEESIRYMESERRILGVSDEVAVQWKLTAMGRAWWLEVQ